MTWPEASRRSVGTVRVVGWNLLQGGGARRPRILDALTHLDGDVLVLSEHRASGPLAADLAAAGWPHQLGAPDPTGGYASVLVASRVPIAPLEPTYTDQDDGHRIVHVDVVGTGWSVVGALIPAPGAGFARTMACWDHLIDGLSPRVGGRSTLIIGDLNTGQRGIDEQGATLRCGERIAELIGLGWTDIWRSLHPDSPVPYTWWSYTGYGFRLDHGFLSPGSPAPTAVTYPAEINGEATTRAGEPKRDGERAPLSDHVPLVVDLPDDGHQPTDLGLADLALA